jgi:hypothetical protein
MTVDVMPKRDQAEIYLGDGLYASFDGFAFWLRAPRETGDHRVALEPDVLRAFLYFIERTKGVHDDQSR